MNESHIGPEELVAYARGELGRQRAGAVRAHCDGCDDCGIQLAGVLLIREAHGIEPRTRAPWRRYVAAAAAVGVIVAGAALWSVRSGPGQTRTVADPGRQPAIAAEGGAVAPLPVSLAGGFDAVLWSIEREVGLALPAAAVGAADAIARGAGFLRAEQAAPAIDVLESHAGDADPRVGLLLGIAQLLEGRNLDAEVTLELSSSLPPGDDARYETYRRAALLFLAEARERTGDSPGARELLTSLTIHYEGDSDWIGDAAAGRLEEIDSAAR